MTVSADFAWFMMLSFRFFSRYGCTRRISADQMGVLTVHVFIRPRRSATTIAFWNLLSLLWTSAAYLASFPVLADQIGKLDQSLVGGVATSARPEVGILQTSEGGCTATLIGQQQFLTAAHCISYRPIHRGGSFVTELNGQRIERKVDRVFSQGRKVGSDDLAVGLLTAPIEGIAPAAVSTLQPRRGDTLTVLGYGCASRPSRAGGGIKQFVQYIYSGGATRNCPGYSGGPVFLGDLQHPQGIVRVNSGYRHYTGRDIGADAVRFSVHINAMLAALRQPEICYRFHVEDLGWMPAACNGAVTGTTGRGRRAEARSRSGHYNLGFRSVIPRIRKDVDG